MCECVECVCRACKCAENVCAPMLCVCVLLGEPLAREEQGLGLRSVPEETRP